MDFNLIDLNQIKLLNTIKNKDVKTNERIKALLKKLF